MIHHVKIRSTGPFAYEVEIDGHAVHCSRLHLTMDPRALPVLEIELPVSVVEFEGESEVEASRDVIFARQDSGADVSTMIADHLVRRHASPYGQMLIEELAQDGS